MSHQLAVVVVNYGSSDLLAAHLPGGTATRLVVVVDNFTTQPERDRVAALADARGWDVVANGTNEGFGAAANAGIDRAWESGVDVVCLINPDAVITEDVLDALVRRALTEPDALVAPMIEASDGRVVFSGSEVDVSAGRTRAADVTRVAHPWLSGACLAFTRDAWRLSGGFVPDYFLYWEDVDLSWQMVANGGRLIVAGDARIVHDAGGTQRRGRASGKSPTYVYYNCRNRLVFAGMRLDEQDARRWMRGSLRYAREVLLRGGSRLVLISPRHVWAASRGTAHGARSARRALADRSARVQTDGAP